MGLHTILRKNLGALICGLLLSQSLVTGTALAVSKLDNNRDKNGYNLASMVTPSKNIILAKVKSLSSKWVGKVIITTADVEPIETIKGKIQSKSLKVSYVGGTVGNIRQTLSHSTLLEEGETAILFLTDAHKKSALAGTQVFSHSQGKIHLLNKNENINRLKSNQRILGLVNKLQAEVRSGGLK